MLILTSALFGISASCLAWILSRWYQDRRSVAVRLAKAPSLMAFPYNIEDVSKSGSGKTFEIGGGKYSKGKLSQDLFLAGIRDRKKVQFFKFLAQLCIYIPLCMVAGYLLAGSFNVNNYLGAAAVGIILFVYTRFFVRMLKTKRQNRILANLPQFLDLVVICVETGLSFTSALRRILDQEDPKEPLTQEFNLMYHEFLGGLSLPQACERLDKRCGVADLSVVLNGIVQSDQMGVSLGNALRVQAGDLRDKLRQRVRARAYQVPVKILFPMMFIFFSFVVLNVGYIGYQLKSVLSTSALGEAKNNPITKVTKDSKFAS